VEIVDDATGLVLAPRETGLVRIGGGSLFRGYIPAGNLTGAEGGFFVTEDLGMLDEGGALHVIGRRDAVIITGGKKVFPSEVEAALRASGQFSDVAVLGVADPEWGQRVVAFHPAGGRAPDALRVETALGGLAAYKRPKAFIPVPDWPRNAQGKVNRAALVRAWAE
jgi:O-succinylbenzoic acid--CoA ligase